MARDTDGSNTGELNRRRLLKGISTATVASTAASGIVSAERTGTRVEERLQEIETEWGDPAMAREAAAEHEELLEELVARGHIGEASVEPLQIGSFRSLASDEELSEAVTLHPAPAGPDTDEITPEYRTRIEGNGATLSVHFQPEKGHAYAKIPNENGQATIITTDGEEPTTSMCGDQTHCIDGCSWYNNRVLKYDCYWDGGTYRCNECYSGCASCTA